MTPTAPEHSKPPERTKLLAVLTGGMVIGTVTLLVLRHRMLVGWPVLTAVAVVWVGSTIALRLRAKTWGREHPVVDWWSLPHFLSGLLLGLFGVGGVLVVVIAVLWEVVEITCRVHEFSKNRIADLVLAGMGWILANVCAGGSYSAW